MKKNKIIYDIETYTYRDSADKQMSLLYKLASDLKRKNLNIKFINKIKHLINHFQ